MNFAVQRAFSNFVMQTTKVMTKIKEIIINSPKYGQKIILIDEEDYELVSKYKWFVNKFHNQFYAITSKWKNNKPNSFLMHRFILGFPSEIIDHKNGNGLDNTKVNLRKCTNSQNIQNSGKQKNNTSGFKGVYLTKHEKRIKKYSAQICVNRKIIRLGRYITAIEAAKAYNEAAIKYHCEFANLNPIP